MDMFIGYVKVLLFSIGFVISLSTCATSQKLTCYDELDRKSTIIEYNVSKSDAIVKESGDEFLCEPIMAVFCTISDGRLEVTDSSLIFTWTRELTGEESIYEVNRNDYSYTGEYAGAFWQGLCEQN